MYFITLDINNKSSVRANPNFSQLKRNVAKTVILKKVTIRFIKLFLIGVFLNTSIPGGLLNLTFLTFLVIGTVTVTVAGDGRSMKVAKNHFPALEAFDSVQSTIQMLNDKSSCYKEKKKFGGDI